MSIFLSLQLGLETFKNTSLLARQQFLVACGQTDTSYMMTSNEVQTVGSRLRSQAMASV